MAFCSNCGTQFPDGTPVCPNCGTPTAAAAYQAQPQQPMYNAANQYAVPSFSGFSIAGLVLGICSTICLIVCFYRVVYFRFSTLISLLFDDDSLSILVWLCIICAILGLIFSIIGLQKNPVGTPGHGLAAAGRALSILPIVFCVIAIIFVLVQYSVGNSGTRSAIPYYFR